MPSSLLRTPPASHIQCCICRYINIYGWTVEQILDNYPTLTPQAVQAVFMFVAECM